ncbi:hypothetical protein R3J21_01760 [Citrobacter werkmanii]|uniref:hypothetical protein n=1 Tax=Citrobacter werkmanii TaxID=67827 RepID=UPI002953533C|nr:hypothetical protein [Citrobacter werkmanii]MDV7070268.1 hypothetical protein [Citrobacter werkmanii]
MTPKESCEIEISRFFKRYFTFTSSPDPDDLYNLLCSLCSSFEKYEIATNKKIGKDNKRYLSLKALRNFYLHHSELLNSSKGIKSSDMGNVRAEVSLLCLLPLEIIERIINDTKQEQTKKYIRETFIFYNNYVDIYPAIFNFAVDLYFLASEASLDISGDSYTEMTTSINYEKQNNFPHYITGKIIPLTGISANDYIDKHIIDMEKRLKEERGFTLSTVRHSKLENTPLEQFKSLSNADKKFIYKDLIATKAIDIHDDHLGKHFTENRPLTPIEQLVLHSFLTRK